MQKRKRLSIPSAHIHSSIFLKCARFKCRLCHRLVYGQVMSFLNEDAQYRWIKGQHKGGPMGPICESCMRDKKYRIIKMEFT